jgi:hypothetical protein
MIPIAYIVHSIKGRVRVQIPEKRKDLSFFLSVENHFNHLTNIEEVVVNDITGSILLKGKDIDTNQIQSYAQKNALFDIQKRQVESISFSLIPKPCTKILTDPIGKIDQIIKQTTHNTVDLAGLFFLSLMGIGTIQIMRGNIAPLSWHTAFWYSLGIYKTLLEPQKTAN